MVENTRTTTTQQQKIDGCIRRLRRHGNKFITSVTVTLYFKSILNRENSMLQQYILLRNGYFFLRVSISSEHKLMSNAKFFLYPAVPYPE